MKTLTGFRHSKRHVVLGKLICLDMVGLWFRLYAGRYRKRPKGAILVLVLLLIALCGAITSQIASRVIRQSGQAADAQLEAQRRWAAVALRRTCLDLAPSLLVNVSQDPNIPSRPLQQRSLEVVLGRERYMVTIQDESAKVPIGRVLKRFSNEPVKPVIRELADSGILLRDIFPSKPSRMSDIVSSTSINDSSASLRFWKTVSERMTLWTDGKINLLTTDPTSLDALWQLEFKSNVPDSILAIRDQERPSDLIESLPGLGLSESQSRFVNDWFSVSSNTYSVWIDTQSGAKSFTAIYVRRRSAGFADENIGFHFP